MLVVHGHLVVCCSNVLCTCGLHGADYGVVLGSKLYIKEVLPGSIAAQDGSLKEGDTVVRVCIVRVRSQQSTDVEHNV